MEKRKWLWKRKSSERSPGETESSGSISSHSERFSDDQEILKTSPNNNAQSLEVSPEVTSKTVASDEDVSIRSLTERLSAALVNVSAKDDLVKQHAKVAEEAVAGWEKAENEVSAIKKQLEEAIQEKLSLEDRVIHLDGALKECVRQLRKAREDQEEKIKEAVAKRTEEWESTKSELENQLNDLRNKAESAKSESPSRIDSDVWHKLEYLEQENASLRLELLSYSEELEVRTIERDLNTQAAETASKQHLESIKKVAKLEAECRRLKTLASRSSTLGDHRTSVASSMYVDSITDSQSDSGEKLNSVEVDNGKMSFSEPKRGEPSGSDLWASALIAELDQFKNEKSVNRNLSASSIKLDLMDDFLEMERLAALPENENGTNHSEQEALAKSSTDEESSLRAELESLIHRTTELEEKLQKVEGEKVELEEKLQKVEQQKVDLEEKLHKMEQQKLELEENLEKVNEERAELEMVLTESQDKNEASELQLRETQMKLEALQEELSVLNETKQQIESQLISMEAETRTMSAKVTSLEAEVEEERAISKKTVVKCQKLEEELCRKKQEIELQQAASLISEPKIKQEDLAVAAGKLAECQKTIASLGQQLKSLATLEDFLIDTSSLPELSAVKQMVVRDTGGQWKLHSNETFSPKRDSGSTKVTSDISTHSLTKIEGNSPPSSSSSSSSAVASNHTSSEKNRNGFAKFFSRSKNGLQLEI